MDKKALQFDAKEKRHKTEVFLFFGFLIFQR